VGSEWDGEMGVKMGLRRLTGKTAVACNHLGYLAVAILNYRSSLGKTRIMSGGS